MSSPFPLSLSILFFWLVFETIYSPSPFTTRGKPVVLGGDPKGNNFLYTTGNAVIIRNIKVYFIRRRISFLHHFIISFIVYFCWLVPIRPPLLLTSTTSTLHKPLLPSMLPLVSTLPVVVWVFLPTSSHFFFLLSPSCLFITSSDVSGTLRIWDTTQLEHPLKIELKVLSGPIADIAWSADSQRLVVVGDGKV